ncbi:MAG: hypothetical protein KAX78_12985 [Phycisphaerae bacterium]|nr:hypothetical protein [Phycisphaerae bacterium]
MPTRSTLAFAGLATALVVSVSVAGAANIYVDNQLADDCTNGEYSIANRDDSGSDGDAYNTIQEAVDVVSAGDTIYIRSGTFYGSGGETSPVVNMYDIDGTSANPILITNYNNETVVCDGSNPTELWFFQLKNCEYITIHGLEFDSVKRHGVYIVYDGSIGDTNNITVEYCYVHDSGNVVTGEYWAGIKSLGPVRHIKYYRCLVHDSGQGLSFGESPTQTTGSAAVPPIAGNTGYSEDMPENEWDSWEGWTDYAARYVTVEECMAYECYGRDEHTDGIGGRYVIEGVYKNNISFSNCDDNFDMIGAVRVQLLGNISFNADPNDTEDGDGNGMKPGVRGGLDNIAARNVLFNNRRAGLDMADTERAEVYNNTVYNNGWKGIWLESSRAETGGAKIVNNIASGNVDDIAKLGATNVVWADNNCVADDNDHNWAFDLGTDSLISTDPLFLDADTTVDTSFPGGLTIPEKLAYIRDQVEDMFALASTSPCVDAGTAVAPYTDGYDGSAPDMGAFESEGTASNTAPTADAGSDDEITLPNYATLDGTVSDDGLPDPPGSLTTTWSKDSGPGTVTFGDAAAVDTTAGFSVEGTYVLKLEADDGTLTDSDTVQIVVNPQGANQAPTANAGSDDEITLPSYATLDGTVSDDDLPDPPASVTTTWSKDSGPGTVTFGDSGAADTTAGFSAAGTYVLKLEASDSDLSDSDTVQIVVNEEGTGTGPFQEEGGTVVMEAENYDNNDTRSDCTNDNWTLGTSTSNYVGDGYMWSGLMHPNQESTWSDACEIGYDIDFETAGTYYIWIRRYCTGSSQNSCLVGLDGTQISIGKFDNSNSGLGGPWTWISTPSAANKVYISTGEHTFQVRRCEEDYRVDRIILTTDGGYTPSGDGPAESSRSGGGPSNTAPTADAGADDECTLPAGVTLDGTVSDDGLPDPPASVTTTWSKTSGPGTVTFGDSSAVDTTAGFSENGVYVLKLEASDGDLSDSDTVAITVNEAGLAPFAEEGGTVVMEAENFDTNDTRSDATGWWLESTDYAGYVGDGHMEAPSNVTETWADAAELTYEIDFSTAGTYYIWVRRYADKKQENTAFVGLDGTQIGGIFDDEEANYDQWYWKQHSTAVYVSAAQHTFNLRRREPQYGVDRIILTDDSGYTPSGNGPAESSRE